MNKYACIRVDKIVSCIISQPPAKKPKSALSMLFEDDDLQLIKFEPAPPAAEILKIKPMFP